MQPTLGLIDDRKAPEEGAAPDPDPGGAPGTPFNFGPEISPGLPAPRSVFFSVIFHGLVIAALMIIRFPAALPPPQPAEQALSPTEIRIGQHVYYVARLSGAQPDAPKEVAKRTQAPQRQAAAARAIAVAHPKLVAPAPPASAAPKALPRAFIPPEVRQSPTARQTLIQPLSPPDLVPPPTPLPTFRILSAQIPRLAKPFLAPGRPTSPPQVPVLNAPAPMEQVHADPQPTNLRPRLPLPRTPPPLDAPPVFDAPDLPPPTPVGDPVNILSLDDRNIPMTDRLVVPAGNIAQLSGEGNGAGSSAGETNSRANGTSAAPSANSNLAGLNNPSASSASGSAATAGSPAGSASGSSTGFPTGSAAGASNGTVTIASSGSPGTGSPGTGRAGPGNTGLGTPGGGTGGGAGAGTARATPGPMVITRPATGSFDAMVVQTSPINQYPEGRGLLTGRPIYSVYFSVGTAADWTFFFCIPGEKPASSNSSLVQLGPPATPVKAPYPYRLVRPEIVLPSWDKYVLVHGYVNQEGRFEGLRVVRSIQPVTDQTLLASLSGWEFRPATKDGVAVMIEFLLSIPAKGL